LKDPSLFLETHPLSRIVRGPSTATGQAGLAQDDRFFESRSRDLLFEGSRGALRTG
jgi:hypothetical protein